MSLLLGLNHYNMKSKDILVLLLLIYVGYQQTTVLSINAIVPCTLNFTFDSSLGVN